MSTVPENKRSDLAVQPGPVTGAMPWTLLSLLLAYSFLSWFNRVSISVAGAEKIIKTKDNPAGILSEGEMGVVYSALIFTYTIFMTPGGWLADRAGPRTALILMGFGSALFVAMTGWDGLLQLPHVDIYLNGALFVTSVGLYYGLVVVRGLMGVFTAPIYPAACRVVSLEVPVLRRAAANGWIMGAALLGIAAAPFAFGFLIDEFTWPSAFVIMGGVTAAAAVAWGIVTGKKPIRNPDVGVVPDRDNVESFSATIMRSTRTPGRSPPWWHLLRNKSLILLTIGYGAVGYYEYLFYFWSQYYFKDVMRLDKDISRLYATLTYVAMAGGMFAGGWLTDRFSGLLGVRRARVLVPAAGLLGGAAFLGLGMFCGDYLKITSMVPICLALANAAVGICEGPLWATAVDVGGRQGATASGIFNTGGNLGGMAAPALTPLIAAKFGWSAAIASGIGACLVAVVFLFLVHPGEPAADQLLEE